MKADKRIFKVQIRINSQEREMLRKIIEMDPDINISDLFRDTLTAKYTEKIANGINTPITPVVEAPITPAFNPAIEPLF